MIQAVQPAKPSPRLRGQWSVGPAVGRYSVVDGREVREVSGGADAPPADAWTLSGESMTRSRTDTPPPAQPATTDQPARPGEDAGTGGGRLAAVWRWLRVRADTRIARLALLWFRRYLDASRNSGAAATAYFTLSALPTALVAIAVFNKAKGDENAFAERLTTHMKLNGSTASLVHDLFGTTSNNLLAATATIVIGFLLWGLAIGQLYQDIYARAWRIHVGTAADQALFTIWFFVVSGLLGLMSVSAAGPAQRPAARADSGLDRRLHHLLALDATLPAAPQDPDPLPPPRRAPSRVRARRHDRHLATVDRAHDQPERQRIRLVRRRPRPVRLHPHRHHHLDDLRRLLPRLDRMATGRERPKRADLAPHARSGASRTPPAPTRTPTGGRRAQRCAAASRPAHRRLGRLHFRCLPSQI